MSGAIIRPDTTAYPELTDDEAFTFLNIDNITELNYGAYRRDLTFLFESTIQRVLQVNDTML